MKRNLFFILFLSLLSGCFSETSKSRRNKEDRNAGSVDQSYFDSFANNNPNTSVPVDDADGRTPPATGSTPINSNAIVIPEQITHCSWSQDGIDGFAATNDHIQGAYTVCKSKVGQKSTQLDIYFQAAKVITDSQLCFIPTTNKDSKTIYVGEARCLNIVSNKQIYQITLIANRYSDSIITGVMIMKDKTYLYPAPFYQYLLGPDAYFFCSRWLDQTGDSSYCQAFKSVGQYFYQELI